MRDGRRRAIVGITAGSVLVAAAMVAGQAGSAAQAVVFSIGTGMVCVLVGGVPAMIVAVPATLAGAALVRAFAGR